MTYTTCNQNFYLIRNIPDFKTKRALVICDTRSTFFPLHCKSRVALFLIVNRHAFIRGHFGAKRNFLGAISVIHIRDGEEKTPSHFRHYTSKEASSMFGTTNKMRKF